MRTTVEIPDKLHHRLVEEASRKRMKGFSAIIVQALREYFRGQNPSTDEKRSRQIKRLRGSLSKEEYKAEFQRLEEGRGHWRA